MKKSTFYYKIFFLRYGLILSVLIMIGFRTYKTLQDHALSTDVDVNIFDFFRLLFIHTETATVDYIYMGDPKTLLGIVSILFIGVIQSSTHFMKSNQQYRYLELVRYKNKKNYIHKMKKTSLKHAILYAVISFTLLLLTVFFVNKDLFSSYSHYPSASLSIITFLLVGYLIVLCFFLFAMSSAMIYINLLKGRLISMVTGLLLTIFIVMVDINMKQVNILLFDYQFYFFDSLLILLSIYIVITILGHYVIKKYET